MMQYDKNSTLLLTLKMGEGAKSQRMLADLQKLENAKIIPRTSKKKRNPTNKILAQ